MARKGENIYKRKDGRWEGRYIKEKIDGKIKYGYIFAHTYKEVKEKLVVIKANQFYTPTKKNPNEIEVQNNNECIYFSEIAKEWLVVHSSQWKQSSNIRYSNIINKHLLPEWGNRNIMEITRTEVMNFIENLLSGVKNNQEGLAPKTVNNIISVLRSILQYANHVKGYRIVDLKNINAKQIQGTLRILSISEQEILSDYLYKNINPTNLGILLCLYTGLRVGEICALKWKDISLKDNIIFINKTMQRLQIQQADNKKTEIIISEPKSECSVRMVPIPDKLLPILSENFTNSEDYVLTGKSEVYVEPRTMQNRFKAVMKKCGLEHANFHSLRHTFATRCIELGFDVKCLSEILGHASVNITLNRYVHPSIQLKMKNMNMLSDLITVK